MELENSQEVAATTTSFSKISGVVQNWAVDENKNRQYMMLRTTYGRFRSLARPELYDSLTGQGEQRTQKAAHIRKLYKEMLAGNYTPTVFAAAVKEQPVDIVKQTATVTIDKPLSLVDGGHRMIAIENLRKDANKKPFIDKLPIECLVTLDRNHVRQDFINYQAGCAVDAAHMTSLKIAQGLLPTDKNGLLPIALDMAKRLYNNSASHLYKLVKFDSQSQAPLGIHTLLSMSSSDLVCSLYGTALIMEHTKQTADFVEEIFCEVYEELKRSLSNLFKPGKFLCQPPEGTRGAASLLIGVVNQVLFRLYLLEHSELLNGDLVDIVNAATEALSENVAGNFSASKKRELMQGFGDYFFEKMLENSETIGSHGGLPIPLLLVLSTSAFGVEKLPRPEKKNSKKTVDLPE